MKTQKIIASLLTSIALLSPVAPLMVYADDVSTIPQNAALADIYQDATPSDSMTSTQIVSQFAKDNGISLSAAATELGINLRVRDLKTYRTLSIQFTVTSTYKPTLLFYCQISESGLFHGIMKILNVNMNRT